MRWRFGSILSMMIRESGQLTGPPVVRLNGPPMMSAGFGFWSGGPLGTSGSVTISDDPTVRRQIPVDHLPEDPGHVGIDAAHPLGHLGSALHDDGPAWPHGLADRCDVDGIAARVVDDDGVLSVQLRGDRLRSVERDDARPRLDVGTRHIDESRIVHGDVALVGLDRQPEVGVPRARADLQDAGRRTGDRSAVVPDRDPDHRRVLLNSRSAGASKSGGRRGVSAIRLSRGTSRAYPSATEVDPRCPAPAISPQ